MSAAVTRRALLIAPTIVATSLIVFALLFVGPDPLHQLTESSAYSSADIERLTEQYGWDRPWHEQYLSWLGDVAHGDWGQSIRTRRPAMEMITERLPLSAGLLLLSMVLSIAIAVPLGALSALRARSGADHAISATSVALMAIPGFFLAILLQLAAVKLKDLTGHTIFFTGGALRDGGPVEVFRRYTLPLLTLTLVQVAVWLRYQRAELLTVLGSDFILAARAKGLSERAVLVRHALRNTALPMVTLIALDLGHLIGGAVIVETVFGLPGLGRLLLDSVQARDTIVVLDLVMLGSLVMMLATAAADALYGKLDPRTRER